MQHPSRSKIGAQSFTDGDTKSARARRDRRADTTTTIALVHQCAHPLVGHTLTELRNREAATPTFRQLIHDVSALLLIDAMSDLRLELVPVLTPVAETTGVRLSERVAFIPVLRAALGILSAALELIPMAPVWHLGIRREETTRRPVTYYNPLQGLTAVERCFVLDLTVVTGRTAISAIGAVKRWADSAGITYVTLVASPEGLGVREAHPGVPIYLVLSTKA